MHSQVLNCLTAGMVGALALMEAGMGKKSGHPGSKKPFNRAKVRKAKKIAYASKRKNNAKKGKATKSRAKPVKRFKSIGKIMVVSGGYEFCLGRVSKFSIEKVA